jgi:hypothetical protein
MENNRGFTVVNEVLMGAALLSVVAVHGLMLLMIARGKAELDGLAPRLTRKLDRDSDTDRFGKPLITANH